MDTIIDTLKSKYSKKELNALAKICESASKIINVFLEESPCDGEVSDVVKLLYWATLKDEVKKEENDIIELILKHAS